MRTVLSNYAQGYLTLPLLLPCLRKGLWDVAAGLQPFTTAVLSDRLQINKVPLAMVLHALEYLGYVSQQPTSGWTLISKDPPYVHTAGSLADWLEFPVEEYLLMNDGSITLQPLLEVLSAVAAAEEERLVQYAEGRWLLPLLLLLHEKGGLPRAAGQVLLAEGISETAVTEITQLFVDRQWLHPYDKTLTNAGQELCEELAALTGILAYGQLLSEPTEWLSGDFATTLSAGLETVLADAGDQQQLEQLVKKIETEQQLSSGQSLTVYAYTDHRDSYLKDNQLSKLARMADQHGVVILEQHWMSPELTGATATTLEPLTGLLPVTAHAFLMKAAAQQLIPAPGYSFKYPSALPHTAATLTYFRKQDYQIRLATIDDLPVLNKLEAACWPSPLQISGPVLRERLEVFPEGQLVLVLQGKVVAVCYSQRIADETLLLQRTMHDVHQLHMADGPVVQLLALNVLPEWQQLCLGDQLLEFTLQRAALMPGVQKVAGVTRCRDYQAHSHIPLEAYIFHTNQQGFCTDTTLRLHAMHGATITALIPGYRPDDGVNLGAGVLVVYDVFNRQLQQPAAVKDIPAEKPPVRKFITSTIQRLLGNQAAAFALNSPLMEMGLDSTNLIDLNETIRFHYQINLTTSFFFEYNTAAEVIAYLEELFPGEEQPVADKVITTMTPVSDHKEESNDIAIIGIALRFPGGATDKRTFWELLRQERCAITEMPAGRVRWPQEIQPLEDHSGIGKGGFLDDISTFDAAFFRISPREAELMDPQQRLLLELSWECLEDAGYNPAALSGSTTGVFVGASGSDYHLLLNEHLSSVEGHMGTAVSMSALPNRISYFYDFNGPSIQVDTACSSSLVSVHEAVKALRTGECNMALAGGINIICHPGTSISYYKLGMLSKDALCKTFDQEANGYVRGEGAALLLLKPLTAAQQDNDPIYAVIKGTATNHGGLASGYTVPNPARQAELLTKAYQNAGVSAATLSYIEAHGTGTSLGDPVEVAGLKKAFSGYELSGAVCGLGSVKTNIGHLEAAAGIAGLIKVILSMQAKTLPASLHFNTLNPQISLEDTPFYIVNHTRPWNVADGTSIRRAGVSSFGSGGANAHVVLEEYTTLPEAADSDTPQLILFSARNSRQLERTIHRFANYLENQEQPLSLRAIARTLQTGRDEMDERAAFIAGSTQELLQQLQDFLAGNTTQPHMFMGRLSPAHRDTEAADDEDMQFTIQAWLKKHKWAKLADAWIKGVRINWQMLYEGQQPARLHLPGYVFADTRYWAIKPTVSVDEPSVIPTLTIPAVTVKNDLPAGIKPLGITLKSSAIVAGERGMTIKADGIAPAILEESLKASLAEALYMNAVDVDVERKFTDMGLDSVVGVEWIRVVNKQYDLHLPATRIYDYPTIREFAAFLHPLLQTSVAQTVPVVTASVTDEAIATTYTRLPEELRQSLAAVLFLEAVDIPYEKNFIELGMDSVLGVEWVRALNKQYGTNIQATKIYDYPTLNDFSAFFGKMVAQQPKAAVVAPVAPTSDTTPVSLPLMETSAHMPAAAYGLTVSGVQTLQELVLSSWEAGTPGENEISITVIASAINFPDVLCVKGLYPTMPEYPFVPGFEVAGVVKAVGAGVESFKPGDEVIALTGKQLGGHAAVVNVPADLTVKKPALWTFEEACSMPMAFVTVYHAFELAKVTAGEKILIHTASGGVGMMALQLAAINGLQVYATAGKQEKLALLEGLHVASPMNYHHDFDKDIQAAGGVDLVLNMLSGVAIQKGLNSLRKGGRYMELAVHGLKTTGTLDLSRLLDNQSFYSIDLRRLSFDKPQECRRMLEVMVELGEKGHIIPLVSRIYPVSRITEAMQYVEQGQHIGKVVVSHRAEVISDLAVHLTATLKAHLHKPLQAVVKPASTPENVQEKIAIIGISGQFPQAASLDIFWQQLRDGKDCITEVPADRWPVDAFYGTDMKAPGKTISKWMGVLEDADKFDPLFFNISPAEAEQIDPQQRLFLESCWHCIEDAGIRPADLAGTDCGVFAGVSANDYAAGVSGDQLNGQGLMGNSSAILSARISYLLNLKGPSLAIDTACSSALVAIAAACDSLLLGRSSLALAGGVNVLAGPQMHIMTSRSGMLSASGRCYAFDNRADGFVPGEGVGVILLKRLSDAERDGDHIYGVISGWGVNQDGKTNGITAPSVLSQAALEEDIYRRFNIDPAGIGMVEAHGTGTQLGDPIEVEALTTAFRKFTDETSYCALGAVKSNIGHLLAAAGVAGVIKVLLALKYREIPPAVHFQTCNEHIALEGSPFYINATPVSWETRRRAAVSSFGFSGTNAHIVIDGYTEKVIAPSNVQAPVFVLSATDKSDLIRYAWQLRHYIAGHSVPCAEMLHVLQTGRQQLAHRLAFVAHNNTEVVTQLDRFLTDEQSAPIYTGIAKRAAPPTAADIEDAATLQQAWVNRGQWEKLALTWASGGIIDWSALYKEKPVRVSLPGYPFRRERYWISQTRIVSGAPTSHHTPPSTVILQPGWKPAIRGLRQDVPAKHVLMYCGLDDQAATVLHTVYPEAAIIAPLYRAQDIGNLYTRYATLLLEIVQGACHQPEQLVLIQVLVPGKSEERLLSGLSGVLQTASREAPHINGQLILTDAEERLFTLLPELPFYSTYHLLHHKDDVLLTRDWQPFTTSGLQHVSWREKGVYLITGGASGLGWLMTNEVTKRLQEVVIVLVGRSVLPENKQVALQRLNTGRIRVVYHQVDVTSKEAISALVNDIIATYGALHGIVHSAGVISDNYLIHKTPEVFGAVMAPKVQGLINIDHATAGVPLDWLLLCSSVAAINGNIGQADYAAANAFMDAYAIYRNDLVTAYQRQGRTLSINWPYWRDGGMQVNTAVQQDLEEEGLYPMSTPEGMQVLESLLSLANGHLLVLHGHTAKLQSALSGQPQLQQGIAASSQLPDAGLLYKHTLVKMKELFAGLTRIDAGRIDEEEPLESYGIDSILITNLNRQLVQLFGNISRTLLFEYQTIGALTRYFTAKYPEACVKWTGMQLQQGTTVETVISLPPVQVAPKAVREPIAIIGVSGRYPQADSLEDFWENLVGGKDCITEIPAERWSLDGFYEPDKEQAIAAGKSYSKWGGFLQDFQAFDPVFFNITPKEAISMDPQERIFLEICWQALEDAGYTKELLDKQHQRKVGVFAGITKTGFDLYGPELWQKGQRQYPRTSFSSVANRISYLLNLQGPSMPVDTMCSSSLTAVHEACEHLLRNECDIAIAGGVNLYVHPSSYVVLSAYRMLSADGSTRSFGAGGDGFVPGEGAGAIILKRLSQAEADGDHIYAIIRGTGINHGGKTNGFTVPNPLAQAALIRKTLDKAGINAAAVSYMEAHGTGTELGDPIEVTGITQAFETDTNSKQFCALGSVKSNIGHLEAAAGIAGITKVLLQMKHGILVPALHAEEHNPNINFSDTPLILQQKIGAWQKPVFVKDGVTYEYPRIAGVSSFGAGGSNAHVILEEYIPASKPVISHPTTNVIVLSALNKERLHLVAIRLLHELQTKNYSPEQFNSIAWTLQTGREAMAERLAFVATSVADIVAKLESYITDSDLPFIYTGNYNRYSENNAAGLTKDEMDTLFPVWAKSASYDRIAAAWIKGYQPDWRLLYGDRQPQRISLPAYPFIRQHVWWPTEQPAMSPLQTPEIFAPVEKISLQQFETPVEQSLIWPDEPDYTIAEIQDALVKSFAEAVLLSPAHIDINKPFIEMGLDSIVGVEWMRTVNNDYQLNLPTTRVYDHPTIKELAAFISGHLNESVEPGETVALKPVHSILVYQSVNIPVEEKKVEPSRPSASASKESIAIIGISGQFPKSPTLETFWDNLQQGRDCISEIPGERWPVDLFYDTDLKAPGKSNSRWMGVLEDADKFDPLFFHISPSEAALMDPQQRLFLENSWRCIEHAGIRPRSLWDSRCGVFAGCAHGDYDDGMQGKDVNAMGLMGCSTAILSARIAYMLNLKGPCLTIDTACSSALVAIADACNSLLMGHCDIALAGGVQVMSNPRTHAMISKAGMLSPTGHCYTFDDRADGFVSGEGVGVFLLKRLTDAERDGDHVYGVIRGWGVNQDGKTNGITAPSVKSQAALEEYVYRHFDIDPATITMVEAHGTGTRLGDPIEVEALTTAFRKFTNKAEYCALGSVKSNIGHLLTAAGASSLIKVLLSMQHKVLPPTINFNQLNAHIQLDNTPFYINTAAKEWKVEGNTPRRAAVSSFGFSGTNVHLVIEEYDRQRPVSEVNTPLSSVFVLSAKTAERLTAYAQSLKSYLVSGTPVDLPSLAYTLQTGRDAMTHRLIMLAAEETTLCTILDRFVAGQSDAGYYAGQVLKEQRSAAAIGKDRLQTVLNNFNDIHFAELAAAWLNGADIDWDSYYQHPRPARIAAPTYPFARERYWLTNPMSPLLDVFNVQPVRLHVDHSTGSEGKVRITLYDDRDGICATFDQLTYTGATPAAATNHSLVLAQPSWRFAMPSDAITGKAVRRILVLCDAPASVTMQLRGNDPLLEVHELNGYSQDEATGYVSHSKAIFSLLQTLLLEKGNESVFIQVVTDNALYAGLHAMLRTVRLENPRIDGQLLLLDNWDELPAALSNGVDHPYVHFKQQASQLQTFIEIPVLPNIAPVWKQKGVYLITGGAGGLGLLFAKEIVSRQPDVTIILTGRSTLNREKQSLLEALRNKGAVIDYQHTDISISEDVTTLVTYILEQYGRLNGILHSAGQIRDNFIIRKTAAELETVLQAKAKGTRLLDHATSHLPLDFFVAFSSVAGSMGNAGQVDYAAANAFMDSYMAYRKTLVTAGQRSGASLSINWPLWQEGGMQIDAATLTLIAKDGFLPMDTTSGMQAFYRGISSGMSQLVVLYGDAQLLRNRILANNVRRNLPESATRHQSNEDLQERTLTALQELLARYIQLAPSLIAADEPLESYGIDSILITTLNQDLSVIFPDIPRTLFFEYQTLGELSAHLSTAYPQACAEWIGASPALIVSQEGVVASKATAGSYTYTYEPIAIVGISGRYPQAANLREFWDNLSAGRESISEIPAERWALEGFYEPDMDKAIAEGKSYSKWGGFITGFADFDPAFFNISPREALTMDPQERIFLEVCWEALEDAGYTKQLLAEKHQHQVGVFAGITKTGFDLYGPGLWEKGEKIFPHTSFSSVANRISYLLNLQGPSLPVDTMCSSSLTAIHEACESLIRRECEVAIAGGVNLYVHPSSYAGLSAHRMLSVDGHLRSFGAGGNGFVPGEGAGSVILKRLSDAIADGDHIYAQIKATGINHGGKTNGYTVPNPVAQAKLVRKTLEKAGISARMVSYIEAHGTGTVLGDPIEVQGLTQAFEKDSQDKQYCALGSVKSNIGHLEAAAGIAGITKIVLQLQHRQLVPSLHIEQINPNINFNRTPLSLQYQLSDWKRPTVRLDDMEKEYPLIAGVSSFGAGGSNAHVILQEYIDNSIPATYDMPAIIVLSAAAQHTLQQIVIRLEEAIIHKGYTDKDLHRIAYTLQTGREHMQWRAALVVNSITELKAGLRQLIAGKGEGSGVFTGNFNKYRKDATGSFPVQNIRSAFASWISDKAYDTIAAEWVSGMQLPWQQLYGTRLPQRISLPAYPFNRQRYWWNDVVAPESLLPEKPSGIRLDLSTVLVEAKAPAQITVAMEELEAALVSSFASTILLPEEDIDIDKPFIDMGLDSIVGVEWIRAVNTQYNTSITVTKVYDHPTIREFAAYLHTQLSGKQTVVTASPAVSGVSVPLIKAVAETVQKDISEEDLEQALITSFAATILLPKEEIDIDKPFIDMGLDSIVGVEWIRAVNNEYNTSITVTKVYDHPTIREFAAYLKSQLSGITTRVASPVVTPATGVSVPLIKPTPKPSNDTLPEHYGLVINKVMTLDELALKPWQVPAPGPGEVTIRVMASAVNFPDTMCVKGLYPTIPDYPFVPGFELAGIVTAIGEGVTSFRLGDEVIALTGRQLGAHASYVNADQQTVVRKPAAWSFEEACSLPVVFVTVYYAFKLGRLSPGEKVLIHTATGGCGLAAIQMARLLNCTLFCTSSKQDKLDILHRIGVHHAFSYKGDFDREVMSLTDNKGVDVVLNMLSGEAIQKGLNSLAPGGRYLELAVHGLKTSGKLNMSALLANQSFYSIDLRRTGADSGESIRDMMSAVVAMAEAGEITPIVSRIYPIADIADALKYVDKGAHIGKVVISHQARQMQDLTVDCIQRLQQVRKRALKETPTEKPLMPRKSVLASEGIAIIGMSGQFPQAPDLKVYWDNLKNGRDAVTEVPDHRWSIAEYYDVDINAPFKSNSKWMGVLDEADKFDPLFFNISPAEALVMDPQQRLFLQNSWHCIEDAGIAPGELAGKRVGVFAGCAAGDYKSEADLVITGQGLMGAAASILSARISYVLNLKGPCLAIDTACSSALVAIADACNSLLLGACDVALAGGVHVMANPVTHVVISKAGMLSPTGHCYTFDERADGFVPGEGVGVVLLKRLEDAERDGDHIYGVIRGWGVNQDGKTNGMTAPSVKSQIALAQEVYDRFNIDPATITMLEAHGTGTRLGDPIEVEGLTTAFRSYTDKIAYCALGSVKSNIGHLLTASGMAGIMKVLLSLRHKMIPPTIHFNRLNEHVVIGNSPFYINDSLRLWETNEGQSRKAAVSAFGFSGTNAHIVIEEYVPVQKDMVSVDQSLLILSAKSALALRNHAIQIRDFLIADPSVQLAAVAFTLQTGRDMMEYRMAFIATDITSAISGLDAFIAGRTQPELFVGQVRKNNGPVDLSAYSNRVLRREEWEHIVWNWINGNTVDWYQLYDLLPARVSLPGYPFEKVSYWMKQDMTAYLPVTTSGQLHPLMHRNVSGLEGICFESRFDGNEYFLADHVVGKQRILPGVAYLEMAYAAWKEAGKGKPVSGLRNVVWLQPLVAGKTGVNVLTRIIPDDGQYNFEIVTVSADDFQIHSKGTYVPGVLTPAGRINIINLKQEAKPWSRIDSLYQQYTLAGIAYGDAYRCVEKVYQGDRYVLARLSLQEAQQTDAGKFTLHPCLLDAAVQASVVLLPPQQDSSTALAFELGEISFDAPESLGTACWALLEFSDEHPGSGRTVRINITLCNDAGDVCLRIRKLSFRALTTSLTTASPTNSSSSLWLLAPVWDVATPGGTIAGISPVAPLIIGGTEAERRQLLQLYPEACILTYAASSTVDEIIDKLKTFHHIAAIWWIAPPSAGTQVAPSAFIAAQDEGLLPCFRLVKALLALGYGTRELQMNIVTRQAQAVFEEERPDPSHATLHGFTGTMAREHPQWKVRLIDLPGEAEWPVLSALELPHDPVGNAWAYRGGLWYRQQLLPVQTGADAKDIYRQGGVYVVIGGAGRLGCAWSEYMISRYQARIIWIGRRAQDAEITASIQNLSAIGEAPLYISADATDKEALQNACDQIRDIYGDIHGVVHSVLIMKGRNLLTMDEEGFVAGVKAKVDVSVRIAEVFGQYPLDFMLFFSSVNSFMKAIGQSNYSAGCVFKDTFAQWLGHYVSCPVKVMNWGYWEDFGKVPSFADFEQWLHSKGIDTILLHEAMEPLMHLLGGSIHQLALMKTIDDSGLADMNVNTLEHISINN
ncbi:SDR family NAD(P)-dependent oxidoreductase [Chitinophaga rhizophila]|uniref:SDR family NAD(P)-dependent oxidoreductase n=1 Tax=Chitinophaga rhizophila TaxID=2866212 RepID=A0ABS7GLY4_9BACT|nr:SDR family NAD(P)-dependent oxidoreductase [Chitinophaga rhizophila]MBW8688280.1 SDR family NAD(P)-dependent oxidoreductase [Chitinophaga rhizophila]